MRRVLTLLLVAFLMVPMAVADGGSGDPQGVRFHPTLDLAGPVHVTATDGSVDAAPAVQAGAPVHLGWERASGWLVHRERTYYSAGPEGVATAPRVTNTTLQYGRGGFEEVRCDDSCRVFLFVPGPGLANLTIDGVADGPVQWSTRTENHWAGSPYPGNRNSFAVLVPPGTLRFGPPHTADETTPIEDAEVSAGGRLGLLLLNATATVRDGSRTTELATGSSEELNRGLGGEPVVRTIHTRYAVLFMEAATFTAPAGAPLVVHTPSARALLQGTAHAPHAFGQSDFDGADTTFAGDSLWVEGDLDLRLAARCGVNGCAGHLGHADLEGSLGGTPSTLLVNGVPAAGALALRHGASALVGAAGLAAGGAAVGWHLLRGVFSGHSRIQPGAVLDNPRRKRIHDLIHAEPGLTAPELARRTGLARIVVQHHLNKLREHSLLVVAHGGRGTHHFTTDRAPPPDLRGPWVLLQDDNRARLARLVAGAAEPVTQRRLAEEADVSQRLVSHHLGALIAAGLVEPLETRPRTYGPGPRLARTLGLMADRFHRQNGKD